MIRRKKSSTTKKINELKDNVAVAVPRPLFGAWLETEIPALGQRTALELIADGELDRLLKYTESYSDPSFA